MQYEKDITAGRLKIETTCELEPLTSVLDFASRRNPKRGYLFVSKVLGKHIPVQPSRMRSIHEKLAKLLPVNHQSLFIGMAETAVGLGAGVADAYTKTNQTTSIFIHTTRYLGSDPVLFEFKEPHSHAVDHILHAPPDNLKEDFFASKIAILVDDEISTGTTLVNLARELVNHLPNVYRIVFVSLVNWLSEERMEECKRELESNGIELLFISLIEGNFSFEPSENWSIDQLPYTQQPKPPAVSPNMAYGRRGVRMPYEFNVEQIEFSRSLPCDKPLHFIGTGEFMFLPQLIAAAYEQKGFNVTVQSTTRSPVLMGDAVQNIETFEDEFGQGIPNYLYNFNADLDAVPVVCYESFEQSQYHTLFSDKRISAFFDICCKGE